MRGKKLTTEQFVYRSKKIHGDEYDYSKTVYVSYHKPLVIICPEHGEFLQRPRRHLEGRGCRKCSLKCNKNLEKPLKLVKWNTETFIKKSLDLFDRYYTYPNTNYVNNYTKVEIVCPKHKEFWQLPYNHLSGKGCLKCAREHFLVGIRESKCFQPWIKSLFPDVKLQYEFKGLPYVVDAYIPSLSLVIEYDENNHLYQKEEDEQRQCIISDMHGVDFYRIKDDGFEKAKIKHEKNLIILKTTLTTAIKD